MISTDSRSELVLARCCKCSASRAIEALAQEPRRGVMLELDDLQHIVMTRVPALTGRYEFLSFRQACQGRAWLAGILDKVASVQQAEESIEREQRWVSVAFTWQGLRALGVDEQSLATFPEEFRQGMVARAEVLGDTGRNQSRSMDWRPRQSGTARDRHSFRAQCWLSASARPERTPGVLGKDAGCRSAFITGPGRHSAVRLRARSFRLSRSAL